MSRTLANTDYCDGNGCVSVGNAGSGPWIMHKALGHPVRWQIVLSLAEADRCCCGELCRTLPLAQSTVSQHLDVLCKSGLVRFEQEGNRSRYTLDRGALAALMAGLAPFAGGHGDGEGA